MVKTWKREAVRWFMWSHRYATLRRKSEIRVIDLLLVHPAKWWPRPNCAVHLIEMNLWQVSRLLILWRCQSTIGANVCLMMACFIFYMFSFYAGKCWQPGNAHNMSVNFRIHTLGIRHAFSLTFVRTFDLTRMDTGTWMVSKMTYPLWLVGFFQPPDLQK